MERWGDDDDEEEEEEDEEEGEVDEEDGESDDDAAAADDDEEKEKEEGGGAAAVDEELQELEAEFWADESEFSQCTIDASKHPLGRKFVLAWLVFRELASWVLPFGLVYLLADALGALVWEPLFVRRLTRYWANNAYRFDEHGRRKKPPTRRQRKQMDKRAAERAAWSELELNHEVRPHVENTEHAITNPFFALPALPALPCLPCLACLPAIDSLDIVLFSCAHCLLRTTESASLSGCSF